MSNMEEMMEQMNSDDFKYKILQHAMFTTPDKCLVNNISKYDDNMELGTKISELIQNGVLTIHGMDKHGRLETTINVQ